MISLRNGCVQSEKPWVPNCRGLLTGIKSRVTKRKNGTWENASADVMQSTRPQNWEVQHQATSHPENRSSTSEWDRKHKSVQTDRMCLLVSCFIGAFPGGETRKKSHKRRRDHCIIRLLPREKTNITGSSVPLRWTSSIYSLQTDQATGCQAKLPLLLLFHRKWNIIWEILKKRKKSPKRAEGVWPSSGYLFSFTGHLLVCQRCGGVRRSFRLTSACGRRLLSR